MNHTTNPQGACPNCSHPHHLPGTECQTPVHHGPNRWHLCLCLARPGAALSCPPQMTCQGGTLGYADVWYLQHGHTLLGEDGTIAPAVFETGVASVGFPSGPDISPSPSAVVSADRATLLREAADAGLRDRIADAIGDFMARECTICGSDFDAADAVLAVLPASGQAASAEVARLRERVAELETYAHGCDAEGCVLPHSSWCERAKKTAAENDGCTCGQPWTGHPQPHAMHCWTVNPPRAEVEEMRREIAELRRVAAEPQAAADLADRLEAALTERFTELGNPFSEMRRHEQGPDGWPASHPVGPNKVAEVLRELMADETPAERPAVAEQPDTQTREAFVPPAHYRGRDGTAYCVHATPVGPDSCRHCRELAE